MARSSISRVRTRHSSAAVVAAASSARGTRWQPRFHEKKAKSAPTYVMLSETNLSPLALSQ